MEEAINMTALTRRPFRRYAQFGQNGGEEHNSSTQLKALQGPIAVVSLPIHKVGLDVRRNFRE